MTQTETTAIDTHSDKAKVLLELGETFMGIVAQHELRQSIYNDRSLREAKECIARWAMHYRKEGGLNFGYDDAEKVIEAVGISRSTALELLAAYEARLFKSN